MINVLLHDLSQRLQELLEVEQDYEAGFALGRHILRHYPRHLITYIQLGQAALAVELYSDAADLLHRALSAQPDSAELWRGLRLATTALDQHDAAEIARQHERDLLASVDDPDASNMAQATAAASVEDWPQALRYYYRAYAEAPERMDVALGMATVLYRVDQFESAKNVCFTILEQLPYCLKANLLLVRCGYELGDQRTNINAYLMTARSIDPDDFYAWCWFGDPADAPPRPKATLPAWNKSERWTYSQPITTNPSP